MDCIVSGIHINRAAEYNDTTHLRGTATKDICIYTDTNDGDNKIRIQIYILVHQTMNGPAENA